MDMIKEWSPAGVAVLRTNDYNSSMVKLLELSLEAMRDNPGMALERIQVKCYGGIRYKGTFGIEFPANLQPEGYALIERLEATA